VEKKGKKIQIKGQCPVHRLISLKIRKLSTEYLGKQFKMPPLAVEITEKSEGNSDK
jgi:hypothetical protein